MTGQDYRVGEPRCARHPAAAARAMLAAGPSEGAEFVARNLRRADHRLGADAKRSLRRIQTVHPGGVR
jgi:hypothetical protein